MRKALAPYDDYDGWFEDRISYHPGFGKLDFVHLPLMTMQKVLPKEYEKLVSYDAYALVRDPMSRFQSAFSQHMKMYHGIELAQMQESDAKKKLNEIITSLNSAPYVVEPQFIHFARQSEFLMNDGARQVEHIYPVTRVNLLLQDLSNRSGQDIHLAAPLNETKIMRFPALQKPIIRTSKLVKDFLPNTVSDPIRRAARQLLMRPIHSKILPIFNTKPIINFVEQYYCEDYIVYEAAMNSTNTFSGSSASGRVKG